MANEDPAPDRETGLVSKAQASSRRILRREFYKKVLTSTSVETSEDLQNLCKAWLDLAGADWVWLWLRYEDNEKRPWELTAAIGKSGNAEDFVPAEKKDVAIEYADCVAEYVADIKKPILVRDIINWRRPVENPKYRVVCIKELQRLNCKSFISVPLLLKQDAATKGFTPYSQIDNIRGLICMHFTTEEPPIQPQHEESYMLMGYATSKAIIASFAAEQHRILFELDRLATRFLNKSGRVEEDRREYLAEVIKLIQRHLKIEFVSVFYRTLHDSNIIACVATTGLSDGVAYLAPSDISNATYERGENITGRVYQTGVPHISKIGSANRSNLNKFKWKERPDKIDESECAWVCYPIKTPETNPSDPNSSETLGVLRCVGNKSSLALKHSRNFDPLQIQTLDFITRQLAPVLETMAIQIAREYMINIIKHDIATPINLIEKQVNEVARCVKNSRRLPEYWLPNIKYALLLARNLAGGLSEKQAYVPESTSMEGHIVAHLMSGLRYWARQEKDMGITYQKVREVFPRLNLDRALIERALTNLIVNAVKYGYSSTDIEISAEEDIDSFKLHVRNFGIGVKEHEKERIFQGEYRSPDVAEEYQGLGLGLKVARLAMRRHNGDLVLTRLTGPTIFTMIFPKSLATSLNQR